MTPRQARRERRAAERKAKKLELRKFRLSGQHPQPAAIRNLEDEFHREVQIRAKADAVSAAPIRPAQRQNPAAETEIGFVSQNRLPPSSSKRAELNRKNAAHSTGPRSPEGKLASSRNSLKHGLASGQPIIPGEDPAAFAALLQALTDEHRPATCTEHLLLKEMAQSYWLTQRAIRLQNECFTGEGVNEKQLALFLRYQATYGRAFYKSLNSLTRLQKDRARAERGFVSHAQSQTNQFVRQTPVEAGFVSQHAPKSDPETAIEPQIRTQPKPRAA